MQFPICSGATRSPLRGWLRQIAFSVLILLAATNALSAQTAAETRGDLEARIQALEDQLKALQGSSAEMPQPGPIVGSPADPAGTFICPPGTYVAGVTAWKSSPSTRYCIGCLTGVQIICRSFTGPPARKQ